MHLAQQRWPKSKYSSFCDVLPPSLLRLQIWFCRKSKLLKTQTVLFKLVLLQATQLGIHFKGKQHWCTSSRDLSTATLLNIERDKKPSAQQQSNSMFQGLCSTTVVQLLPGKSLLLKHTWTKDPVWVQSDEGMLAQSSLTYDIGENYNFFEGEPPQSLKVNPRLEVDSVTNKKGLGSPWDWLERSGLFSS